MNLLARALQRVLDALPPETPPPDTRAAPDAYSDLLRDTRLDPENGVDTNGGMP